MNYLICQDWINTSNNHDGMKYLCSRLVELYPDTYKSFVITDYVGIYKSQNRIINILNTYSAKFKHKFKEIKILNILRKNVVPGDNIILMEYMDGTYSMLQFAQVAKKFFKNIKVYALVHLTPGKLEHIIISRNKFNALIKPIDKFFTLGSSLTQYLISKGLAENKIYTTFHYVDEYYYKENPVVSQKIPTVIAMGNQARNIQLLKLIVKDNPNVNFIICQGIQHFEPLFQDVSNVALISFVPEAELKSYMDQADISLNVMEDTIGSNVIVTSLAMGLAMICSDVGSIRDYCDDSNTFFCNTIKEYNDAIYELTHNPNKLYLMKQSAYAQGKKLSINNFSKDLICGIYDHN